MGVSKNRGTPKSSILIGFFLINHPFWGTTIFWKLPCCYVMHSHGWQSHDITMFFKKKPPGGFPKLDQLTFHWFLDLPTSAQAVDKASRKEVSKWPSGARNKKWHNKFVKPHGPSTINNELVNLPPPPTIPPQK